VNDGYIILQIKNTDARLEVLWFLSDLDLSESFIKRGFGIDSHKSLLIAQTLPFQPGQGAGGAAG